MTAPSEVDTPLSDAELDMVRRVLVTAIGDAPIHPAASLYVPRLLATIDRYRRAQDAVGREGLDLEPHWIDFADTVMDYFRENGIADMSGDDLKIELEGVHKDILIMKCKVFAKHISMLSTRPAPEARTCPQCGAKAGGEGNTYQCKKLSWQECGLNKAAPEAPQTAPDEVLALRGALRNMADAYVRKVKTGLTEADIAKEPWRCQEYIVAEQLCKTEFKMHFTREWLMEKIKNDPNDLPCEIGPAAPDAEAVTRETHKIRELVDRQAEDEGLWFEAETAPEAYLQQELRKLHAIVESNIQRKVQK